MERRHLLLYIIVFLFYNCKKEPFKVDQKSSDSVEIYFQQLSKKSVSQAKKIQYNKRIVDLLKSDKNDSINRDYLFKAANNYFELLAWKDFYNVSNIVLEKSIAVSDTISIAKAYRYKAEYYKNINLIDSSFYFYLKSEKLYAKLNDKQNLGKVLLKKGIIQFFANDYLGADLSTSHAYNLLKESDDKQTVYQAISMLGIISNEMKDYNRAVQRHFEALNVLKQNNISNDFYQIETSLNNIGNVYQNLEQNSEAVKNFKQALKNQSLSTGSPDLYAILLDNLAYSEFKLHNTSNLPMLFYRSLKIRDSLNNTSGVILSKIHLSEFYASQKDSLKAQTFAHEAYDLAKLTKAPGDRLASLKQLSAIEHKNVSIYSKEYIKINDSLQQAERKSQNKFARIQLETDEILFEKDKLAEQNRNLLYYFGATLLIGLLLFIIRNQRAKNRELMLIQAQQKANEEIYSLMISQQETIEESRVKEKKRIAQELHDGVLGRLFGARLNLDSLNKFDDEESINSRFNYLNELKNIEQDIREISHDLNREKYVLINNFIAIVNNLLEEQKNSHAPDIIWNIDEAIKWDVVSNTTKINLYRILQESLQNINKYAQAKKIEISINKESDLIILKVIDDGIGFEVLNKRKGIGLQNMESRVVECNGIFDVKSKKGKGTAIIISIPISSI